MQLYQVFLELSSYDKNIVSSTRYSRQGDNTNIQIKGKENIKVSGDINKNLIISFTKYGGDIESTQPVPFERNKNISVIIGAPKQGEAADSEVGKIALDGIAYNLGLNESSVEKEAGGALNYVVTMALGSLKSNIPGYIATTLTYAFELTGTTADNQVKILERAKKIEALGEVLDIFNMYCVVSLIREEGEAEEYNYRIYSTYRSDRKDEGMTKECIKNFNENLSKGGNCEQCAEKIGYDENNPITEENFASRIDEISAMLSEYRRLYGADPEELTGRLNP